MAEQICPKCGGTLQYDTAEALFVCPACGNRFFREMIFGSVAERQDVKVYCAPQSGAGELALTSQYERDSAPVEVPQPPVPSEHLDANVTPKAAKVTRRTQRYMARYDRAQEKRERERREVGAEIVRCEASLSVANERVNQRSVGTPRVVAPTEITPVTPLVEAAPEAGAMAASIASEVPMASAATEPDGLSRERLRIKVREAQLLLKAKKKAHKHLSREIWRLEQRAGQTRRDFRRELEEANQAIDRAALEVRDAEVQVKEAKRRYRKAK